MNVRERADELLDALALGHNLSPIEDTSGHWVAIDQEPINDLRARLAVLSAERDEALRERDLAYKCIDALEVGLFGTLEGRSRDTLEARVAALLPLAERPKEEA